MRHKVGVIPRGTESLFLEILRGYHEAFDDISFVYEDREPQWAEVLIPERLAEHWDQGLVWFVAAFRLTYKELYND